MADEVAATSAGWAVEMTTEGIADGNLKILRAPAADLRRFEENRRQLAGERYSWHQSAARAVEAYRRYAA